MTAARLSPAGSLLRTSRLFSIPAPLALPPSEPSSEQIAYSDTATTPYPTRAALETPKESLQRGDWGLKRALPTKTTTKTGTPTYRIRGGIDTPEHVADFESAADHVITLRKFQELNQRIILPRERNDAPMRSPFNQHLDNTTDAQPVNVGVGVKSWLERDTSTRMARLPQHLKKALEEAKEAKAAASPSETVQSEPPLGRQSNPISQPKRRWRYTGPHLAAMNDSEFDRFLDSVTKEKRATFEALVKENLTLKRQEEHRARALAEGSSEERSHVEVTDEELREHIRRLRSDPRQFGPLIAEFFDLADGPKPQQYQGTQWEYGRDTIATDVYADSGPPRTHPSAGLNYLRSGRYTSNDLLIGPKSENGPVAARVLQSQMTNSSSHRALVGVAGFSAGFVQDEYGTRTWKWAPVKDGPKLPVRIMQAQVNPMGKLELRTRMAKDWSVEDDVPVADHDRKGRATSNSSTTPRLEHLDRHRPQRALGRSRSVQHDPDMADKLGEIQNSSWSGQ